MKTDKPAIKYQDLEIALALVPERRLYAAMFLQGMLASGNFRVDKVELDSAEVAVQYADALIVELDKEQDA